MIRDTHTNDQRQRHTHMIRQTDNMQLNKSVFTHTHTHLFRRVVPGPERVQSG